MRKPLASRKMFALALLVGGGGCAAWLSARETSGFSLFGEVETEAASLRSDIAWGIGVIEARTTDPVERRRQMDEYLSLNSEAVLLERELSAALSATRDEMELREPRPGAVPEQLHPNDVAVFSLRSEIGTALDAAGENAGDDPVERRRRVDIALHETSALITEEKRLSAENAAARGPEAPLGSKSVDQFPVLLGTQEELELNDIRSALASGFDAVQQAGDPLARRRAVDAFETGNRDLLDAERRLDAVVRDQLTLIQPTPTNPTAPDPTDKE